MEEDPAELFRRLNDELYSQIDQQYFQEPKDFKSLVEVLNVLESRVDQIIYQNRGSSESGNETSATLVDLMKQLDVVKRVIEDVVSFQQGGMNNSLDTMREVVKEYTQGRDEINRLRKSLAETKTVLTAKKGEQSGHTALRDLWLKKAELQESLRLVREIELLKNVPHKVFRLMQQKRYYATVLTLNDAVTKMFGEDLVHVGALVQIRENIMDLKENLLEACVQELNEQIIGSLPDYLAKESQDTSDLGSVTDYEAASDAGGGMGGMGSVFDGAHSVGRGAPSESGRSARPSINIPFGGSGSRYASSVTGDQSPFAHAAAGTGLHSQAGGGLLSPPGSGSQSGPLPQYRDLAEVDDTTESALVDPSSAGFVYLRLLVKTISALKCEDDAERLVFEALYARFTTVLLQLKEAVHKRRSDLLLQEELAQGGGDATALTVRDGKAFALYISGLLDGVVGIVTRLLYVCGLLSLSKSVHTGVLTITQQGQSSSPSNPTIYDLPATDRDHARRLVLTTWHDFEDKVWQEIVRHLSDPDVMKISDVVTQRGQPIASAAMLAATAGATEGGEDEGEESKVVTDRLLLFLPSSSHAAAVYSRVNAYMTSIQRIFKDYGIDSVATFGAAEGGAGGSGNSSFVPRPQSVAVTGSGGKEKQTILSMMRGQQQQRTLTDMLSSRIFEHLQSFLETELIPIVQSSVNGEMRDMQVMPEYFAPNSSPPALSDSSQPPASTPASSAARRSQSIPASPVLQHVPPCKAADRTLFHAEALLRYWLQLAQHRTMISVVLDRLLRGFNASAKDQVEGWTLSWSCSQVVMEKALLKNHLQVLEDDAIYSSYYSQRVLQGKLSIEESLLPASQARTNSTSGGGNTATQQPPAVRSLLSTSPPGAGDSPLANMATPSLSAATQRPLSVVYAQELQLQPVGVWDYGNPTYPLPESQALAPLIQMSNIQSVACVAASCDWLVHRLCILHNQTMRKAFLTHHQASGQRNSINVSAGASTRGSFTSSTTTRRPSSVESAPSPTALSATAMHQGEAQLKETHSLALQELQKLSKSTLIYLRHAAQTLCFYYMQKLVHVSFLASSSSSSAPQVAVGNSSGSETGAEDGILSALMQHLYVFFEAVVTGYGNPLPGSSGGAIVAVVFGPLVTLMPRLLLRALTVILSHSAAASSASAVTGPARQTATLNKTRLLRLIVSAQQVFSAFLQHRLTASEGESRRRLLDVLSEECERARKVASLVESSATEVRAYFRKAFRDLDRETARALWARATDRAGEGSFDEVWRDLELSQPQHAEAPRRSSDTANVTTAWSGEGQKPNRRASRYS